MGLKGTIDKAVVSAFRAIGDLNTPMTYRSATGQIVRDLDAGTSFPVTVDYALKYSVFVKFTTEENDKDPTTLTASKLIFPTSLLPVEPKDTDILLGNGNRTWEVMKLLSVPGDSLTSLQVRSTK